MKQKKYFLKSYLIKRVLDLATSVDIYLLKVSRRSNETCQGKTLANRKLPLLGKENWSSAQLSPLLSLHTEQ